MKPIGSSTGLCKTTDDTSTGTPLGELVAATGDNTPALFAALKLWRPRKLDEALLSQMQRHGAELSVKTQARFPVGPNGENLPMRLTAVSASCRWRDGIDVEVAQGACLADAAGAMAAAPPDVLEGWLAELSAITAQRKGSEIDAELMLTAYTTRLLKFPADVARHALHGETWKWFPTWQELEAVCTQAASIRTVVRDAVAAPPKDLPPEPRIETDEEAEARRARMHDIARETMARLGKSPAAAVPHEWHKDLKPVGGPMLELARLRNKQLTHHITDAEAKRLSELENLESAELSRRQQRRGPAT